MRKFAPVLLPLTVLLSSCESSKTKRMTPQELGRTIGECKTEEKTKTGTAIIDKNKLFERLGPPTSTQPLKGQKAIRYECATGEVILILGNETPATFEVMGGVLLVLRARRFRGKTQVLVDECSRSFPGVFRARNNQETPPGNGR